MRPLVLTFKICEDINGEPTNLELEESIQKYVFEDIIMVKLKEEDDEFKNIRDIILEHYS